MYKSHKTRFSAGEMAAALLLGAGGILKCAGWRTAASTEPAAKMESKPELITFSFFLFV
jgi:hypothetical protein